MHGTRRQAPHPHRPGRPRPGLLLCAGLLLAGAAAAQVERTGDYLQRMDTDGDGRISQDEYVAWMSYAFERMDADGDGVLSTTELPGGRGKPITIEEHRRRLAERFVRQDADKSGHLDARELAAPPL
ncbi:EF-hand domain-containing protein [Pseudoxanthomonas daejeonensis]|uniref:EF-hand domain-containing protein n=1 Tax=Pseudoxanthomonas daejeonensis TaxID=266062 RepID=UPI001F53EDEC|nr:EF-hand domain-containing protein [Pseudoxanthomonas daejeonensis]UNK58891.1 EF-hand domain-containing protein [Pseudoxanthomonas daejeonensis]